MRTIISIFTVLLVITLTAFPARAGDKEDLKSLLDHFLTSQSEAAHNSFWADDLIYTSSNGTRFDKKFIMDGFKARKESSEPADNSIRYSAEEVQIKLFGNMAIVAFKLVAKKSGQVDQTFWNTGTFQKRNSIWQAVAWQATKIPQK